MDIFDNLEKIESIKRELDLPITFSDINETKILEIIELLYNSGILRLNGIEVFASQLWRTSWFKDNLRENHSAILGEYRIVKPTLGGVEIEIEKIK